MLKDTHELCSHCTAYIAQGRVVLYNTLRDQVVKLRGDQPCMSRTREKTRTANKYLLSPIRSKYRRQNGNVPKFLLIDFNSDLAEVSLTIEYQTGARKSANKVTDFNGGLLGPS